MAISAPQPAPVSPTSQPFSGTLEIVTQDDDGPPNGVTLDQAIDITLERSLDLRSKFYEIPMARADTLQANLRANPVFYQDGQLLQYRGTSTQFTRAAPGGPSQFDTNITYPLDISHKRQARTVVATRAEKVLEALFQDAVRQRIDDVIRRFRLGPVRSPDGALCQCERQRARCTPGKERGVIRERGHFSDRDQPGENPLPHFEAGSRRRGGSVPQSQARPGGAMNLKLAEIKTLELKGTINDVSPPPPPADELRKIALADRPDIVSFRLGIVRAEADVRLARANAFSDVYVLWQPYTFQDNTPYGLKSQYSWALGVTVPMPIYNRNQGGIERAKINVTQSQMQLADQERQVQIDVEEAVQEYEVSRRYVDDLREQVVRPAKHNLDNANKLYTEGQKPPRVPGRSARLQRGREAVSRYRGSPPAEHAFAQYRRGPADHALRLLGTDSSARYEDSGSSVRPMGRC